MKQKVITKVLKISDNTKEKMIKYFEDKKRPKTPDYAIFQADEADTVVTLYTSGKVVFQGISADIDANMWDEMERHLNGKSGLQEKKEKKEEKDKPEKTLPMKINSIGSDEVGTGDYFGPIVVTASYVSVDNVDYLIELGVKDSKKMTDEQILKVVPELIKKVPYHTYILKNPDYNKYYGTTMNMNKIKAILHNKVLFEMVSENRPCDFVVVDQFEYPNSYYAHISESTNKIKNIFFMTKAEDKCLSVACSSVISRYIFLSEMNKLSKELNMELPKGASPAVDEAAKKIVAIYGEEKLKEIAKLNFKNTEKILNN